MLCILYVNAVAALLGVVATLVERILPGTASRRWIWCAVIALSLAIPPIYQASHASAVSATVQHESTHGALGHALMMTSLSVTNAASWGNATSFDRPIHVIWMTGSALVLLLGISNALRVRYALSVSRRKRRPTTLDGIPVLITDAIGPATVGVFRARVLVPRWVLALPVVQRQYVLRHEEEHRSRRPRIVASSFNRPFSAEERSSAGLLYCSPRNRYAIFSGSSSRSLPPCFCISCFPCLTRYPTRGHGRHALQRRPLTQSLDLLHHTLTSRPGKIRNDE